MDNPLTGLGACQSAIDWCEGKSKVEAWDICKRGDWMFWLCAKASISSDRKQLVSCACDCVRLTLDKFPERDYTRAKFNLSMVELWLNSEKDVEEMQSILQKDFEVDLDMASYELGLLTTATDDLINIAIGFISAVGSSLTVKRGSLSSSFDQLAVVIRKHYPVWPLA